MVYIWNINNTKDKHTLESLCFHLMIKNKQTLMNIGALFYRKQLHTTYFSPCPLIVLFLLRSIGQRTINKPSKRKIKYSQTDLRNQTTFNKHPKTVCSNITSNTLDARLFKSGLEQQLYLECRWLYTPFRLYIASRMGIEKKPNPSLLLLRHKISPKRRRNELRWYKMDK